MKKHVRVRSQQRFALVSCTLLGLITHCVPSAFAVSVLEWDLCFAPTPESMIREGMPTAFAPLLPAMHSEKLVVATARDERGAVVHQSVIFRSRYAIQLDAADADTPRWVLTEGMRIVVLEREVDASWSAQVLIDIRPEGLAEARDPNPVWGMDFIGALGPTSVAPDRSRCAVGVRVFWERLQSMVLILQLDAMDREPLPVRLGTERVISIDWLNDGMLVARLRDGTEHRIDAALGAQPED